VLEFQRHFGLLGADVEKIVTSTNKIASRGQKIEDLDFEQAGTGTVIAVIGGGGVVV
jgi:hypothetical protein